ncbi:MAG: hypothetical protein IJR89_06235 [Clostridia bacterium]|nr:hypothetical protein [Clostridia bacterium]
MKDDRSRRRGAGAKDEPLSAVLPDQDAALPANLPQNGGEDDLEDLRAKFGGARPGEYYTKVSKRYRGGKIFLILLLIALILLIFVFGAGSFTYANLRYLARNLGEATLGGGERAEEIAIGADGNADFAVFKGKIAVAGESGVSLYRASGKELYTEKIALGAPRLIASDRYFLLWSAGENSYGVFNAVSLLKTATLDYPIYGAALAENGSYALITKTRLYPSSVFLYDRNFKLKTEYNKSDAYYSSVAFSEDGKTIALLSFSVQSGFYSTLLEVYGIGETEPTFTCRFAKEFPIACFLASNGRAVLVTDAAYSSYDAEGKEIFRREYNGTPVKTLFSDGSLALLFTEQNRRGTRVLLSALTGETLLDAYAEPDVSDAVFYQGRIAVLSLVTEIFDPATGERTVLEKEKGAVALLADGDALYSCSKERIALLLPKE